MPPAINSLFTLEAARANVAVVEVFLIANVTASNERHPRKCDASESLVGQCELRTIVTVWSET